MSIWSENPEWFDAWIEQQAINGYFGSEVQNKVENGELVGYELWDLDKNGSLGGEALLAYCERLIP